jgi:two-component system, cell cycle sensor histidine kinase PleC
MPILRVKTMLPERPSEAISADSQVDAGGGVCRVLVVDDEPAILADYRHAFLATVPDEGTKAYSNLATELFGDSDVDARDHFTIAFDLVICSQGAEAVEAVRQALAEQRPFSVAFIDVRMPPGIDGVTAAERMHELDPNLNTVIVTGYSDIPRREISRRLTYGNFLYFQKPFLADEFMQLAWTLHIKRQRELEFRTLNANLQEEVERRSYEIRVALRKALEGARAKSTFLSNMSHELRTPLNAIIGFSDIIQGQHFGPIGQARYVDYAADINSSAQHLLNLINDVLDFSKIEAGGVTLNEAIADIDEMIAFSIRLLSVRAAQKDIEIRHTRLPHQGLL